MDKKRTRLRRAAATRRRIADLGANRLVVHRTPRHIYAQLISGETGQVVCAASTVEEAVRGAVKYTGNVEAAAKIGELIAERALAKGVTNVAFDRSGFQYHGRVKALADAVRANGLQF